MSLGIHAQFIISKLSFILTHLPLQITYRNQLEAYVIGAEVQSEYYSFSHFNVHNPSQLRILLKCRSRVIRKSVGPKVLHF